MEPFDMRERAIRLLVCGGRDFSDRRLVDEILTRFATRMDADGMWIDVVMHGDARGADRMAGEWAREHGKRVLVFRADWKGLGPEAGPARNERMLVDGRPTHAIAFAGGPGARDMTRRLIGTNVTTYEVHARDKITTRRGSR